MLKNFKWGVTWRVGLLVGTIFLWGYVLLRTDFYVTMTMLGVVVGIEVYTLTRYVDQTNRKLTRFLESIRYSDFSRSFPDEGLGSSFRDLNRAFEEVIEEFREERGKKQESTHYLQTVVQHIGIGLICFRDNGNVELINSAAKELFDIKTLLNINSLDDVDKQLPGKLNSLKGGSRTLIRLQTGQEPLQLAMHATEFRMHGERYKLVSFQNIHSELEEKEMEAWQNLTQVLAHEIMNSITPIASLSDTASTLLDNNAQPANGVYQIEKEALKDTKDALDTIKNRSRGLMRFVNSYREFTQIPEPDFERFKVKGLLDRIRSLNKGEAESHGISVEIDVDPESLEIEGDPQLIEQALINLMKNAMRAVKNTEKPEIKLSAAKNEENNVQIKVEDNGPGIKQNDLHKIFIPFYTTDQQKSGGGSGIGLSLSRQIVRKHGGTLAVRSEKGKGTTFSITI